MKRLFFAVLIICMMIFTTAAAHDKKILYVPIDNRPCNLYQVVQVADKLDYEILSPPAELFGKHGKPGDVKALWSWLYENAPQADYAVLSTDALLYGSLVDSRMHNLTDAQVMERARRFSKFNDDFPNVIIYTFAVIMRTPHYNFSGEVPYYETHGEKLFKYSALLDKHETNQLTRREQRELDKLEADIPKEYIDDWFKRRARNFNANALFVEYARKGIFDYFLIGCDDSAEYGQTHREARHLSLQSADLGKTVTQVTSGADELGMLMVSRAINLDQGRMPFVAVVYNAGKGPETFPTYCNETIGVSVDAAIIAAGGLKIPAPERADLVLLVNTNANGKTYEATNPKRNKFKMRGDLKPFMAMIKNFVDKNYPVAIADVAFANGADNALMTQLKRDDLQYKIRAYGGWNTATNSSGFVIGAGVLTHFMDDTEIAELLTTRYLDDWAYEANIRQELIATIYGMGGNPWNIDADKLPQLEQLLTEKMTAFAAENLRVPSRWHFGNLKVYMPWNRTFECDPRFTFN